MDDLNQRISEKSDKKQFDWTFIIVLSIIIFLFLLIYIPKFIHEYKYSYKQDLIRCEGNLRNLGLVIENYKTFHKGHFPQSLEVLVEQTNIGELPTCLITGKLYILKVDGWDSEDFTLSCPNPEQHVGNSDRKSETEELYFYPGKGVIQKDK